MKALRFLLLVTMVLGAPGCGDNIDEMPHFDIAGGGTGGGGGGGGAVITITPTTLPDGTVNAVYSQTLSASGGTAPYTWSVISGALPTGLTLGTGTIAGTPTAAGTYSFTVQARDSSLSTGSQALTIIIYTVPSITTTTIAAAQQGVPYSQVLAATGGQTPYSWSTVSGALPTGISLNANGTITGTTTDPAGDYIIEVRVTDAGSRQSATVFLTLTVNAGITLSPTTLPAGTAGTAYSQTITVSGGSPDYTCSLSNGTLPNGLSLATVVPDTCTITGTPTVAGTSSFQITATDIWSDTGSQNYSITIDLGMSTTTLPDASVPAGAYSQDLKALLQGETGITTWTQTGGSLPTLGAWSLSADGVVSGTPDALQAGMTFTFDVQVTDSATTPNTATFTLSVTVVP